VHLQRGLIVLVSTLLPTLEGWQQQQQPQPSPPSSLKRSTLTSSSSDGNIIRNGHAIEKETKIDNLQRSDPSARRDVLVKTLHSVLLWGSCTSSSWMLLSMNPQPAMAKCKDLETCREIGERRDAEDLAANPIVRIGNGGLQYKVLAVGLGDEIVTEDTDTVKIAYSISQASGSYMYSQGFGFNKLDAGNGKRVADLGLDGITVHMTDDTAREVPIGVKRAIVGMKRGERRRIVVPPELGFETSDWNPKPTTFRGERQIISYQTVLSGRGGQLPPFPAPTIWDVELLALR